MRLNIYYEIILHPSADNHSPIRRRSHTHTETKRGVWPSSVKDVQMVWFNNQLPAQTPDWFCFVCAHVKISLLVRRDYTLFSSHWRQEKPIILWFNTHCSEWLKQPLIACKHFPNSSQRGHSVRSSVWTATLKPLWLAVARIQNFPLWTWWDWCRLDTWMHCIILHTMHFRNTRDAKRGEI